LKLRAGARVVVREKPATFVKNWGSAGAVVRYDHDPGRPRVVPLTRIAAAAG
jgi:hypothetical protein